MGRVQIILFLLLLLIGGALSFIAVRYWVGAAYADVRDVAPGHQEIAWISPATNGDAWERLIAALELLQREAHAPAVPGASAGPLGKTFHVTFDNAFLPMTADVPEVALYFDDAPDAKLWIRWYKLSGENPSPSWFAKLKHRARPPVAIVGGETTDRALFQTRALQKERASWPGPAPLYL